MKSSLILIIAFTVSTEALGETNERVGIPPVLVPGANPRSAAYPSSSRSGVLGNSEGPLSSPSSGKTSTKDSGKYASIPDSLIPGLRSNMKNKYSISPDLIYEGSQKAGSSGTHSPLGTPEKNFPPTGFVNTGIRPPGGSPKRNKDKFSLDTDNSSETPIRRRQQNFPPSLVPGGSPVSQGSRSPLSQGSSPLSQGGSPLSQGGISSKTLGCHHHWFLVTRQVTIHLFILI